MKGAILTLRRHWAAEIVLGLLIVVLLAIAGGLVPNFLNLKSQMLLSRHVWEIAIISVAMTLIIISGGIDLSVGSTMGLSAVAFGIVLTHTGVVWLGVASALMIGIACGALNGWLISRFRVHPLIITLATYAAYRGIAEGVSQGVSYSRFGDGFSQLGRGMWFGLPIAGYLFLALALSASLWLSRTAWGRYLYAFGINERAARFSGIPTKPIQFWLYVFSGLLSGIASLIYISRFDTAKADAGTGYELDVITAVVVGGTSISGGKGRILGTALGVLLIHQTRLFVGRYWQAEELKSIVIGGLLIVSVLVYRFLNPKSQNDS